MSRDYAMARLAEARGRVVRLSNFLDDAIEFFIDPSEDPKKRERAELLDAMVSEAGELSRVIEQIQDDGFDFEDVADGNEDGSDEGEEDEDGLQAEG